MTATDGQTTGANTDLMRLYFDLDSRLNLQNLPPETKGHITFSNARMIDNNGETLPYGLKSTHICLSTCVQNIAPSDSSSTKNSLDKFSTFPNPVQDNLSVELTDSDHAMLRIYNLMGNLLIEKELKQTRSTTDVSLLQRGIYLVEISDETGKATHRILK
jgi:hypothetical protein